MTVRILMRRTSVIDSQHKSESRLKRELEISVVCTHKARALYLMHVIVAGAARAGEEQISVTRLALRLLDLAFVSLSAACTP